jgi:hypothetical protein
MKNFLKKSAEDSTRVVVEVDKKKGLLQEN